MIEVPEDITGAVRPRGEGSQQKEIQEEREKNTLGALYISAAQIPDSPAEPSGQIMIEQVDLEVKSMRAGVEIQPFFQQAMSVSDLVGQLRSTDVMATGPGEHLGMNGTGVSDMTMGDTTAQAAASALQSIDLRKLGLDPGALSLLAQQLATQYGLNPSDPSVQNQQNWNFGNSQNASASSSGGSYNDYGYDERGHDRDREHDERGRNHERGSWRGGRGRGTGGPRGRGGEFKGRRKPCTFFAQGRQVLNLHLLSLYSLLSLHSFVHSPHFFLHLFSLFVSDEKCGSILIFLGTRIKERKANLNICDVTDANLVMRVTSVTSRLCSTRGSAKNFRKIDPKPRHLRARAVSIFIIAQKKGIISLLFNYLLSFLHLFHGVFFTFMHKYATFVYALLLSQSCL